MQIELKILLNFTQTRGQYLLRMRSKYIAYAEAEKNQSALWNDEMCNLVSRCIIVVLRILQTHFTIFDCSIDGFLIFRKLIFCSGSSSTKILPTGNRQICRIVSMSSTQVRYDCLSSSAHVTIEMLSGHVSYGWFENTSTIFDGNIDGLASHI